VHWFHDLRHTYASLLIEQGAHPKYIQEQMGHSSIQVTMDVYGHLFPSSNREWAGKLDKSGWEPKSATQPQPELTPLEQPTHKILVAIESRSDTLLRGQRSVAGWYLARQ
jgi:integrase